MQARIAHQDRPISGFRKRSAKSSHAASATPVCRSDLSRIDIQAGNQGPQYPQGFKIATGLDL